MAHRWDHSDLSLYVDDGAIFSVSKTLKAATERATAYHGEVLTWLQEKGLNIDPSKSELVTFTKAKLNRDLIGGPIKGTHFQFAGKTECITHTTNVRYLGVYLDHRLDWS